MPRQQSRKPEHGVSEVIGLILLACGTLLFLSLVSYEPSDLPGWLWISHKTPQNDPIHNFIGITGAVTAGVLYFLLGAAAYLVSVILLGYGGVKLFDLPFRILPKMPWIATFILSGACLLHLQDAALQNWGGQFNIQGPGGWLGYILGEGLLANTMGRIGSGVLLVALYLASLIRMTGLRPIRLVLHLRRTFAEFLAQREKQRREKADVKERIELDRRRLEREQKKLERELRKQKAREGKSADAGEDNPAQTFPEPRIIDATAPEPRVPKSGNADEPRKPPLEFRDGVSFENYELPGVDLLDAFDPKSREAADPGELRTIQNTLIDTLQQFNISVSAGDITRGPTITRYEVYPAKGVRVDKIVNLERDLARATRAERINILAPIPGKDTVGIELANSKKVTVTFREILESEEWKNSKAQIPLALGKDVYGRVIIGDLAKMPHCLVAGTTGSGKSVCINSMVASMLYKFSPDDLRLIMIDPKVVELQMYNKLPHLVVPVVNDSKKVLLALRWVIDEMEKRYKIFAKSGVRNIVGFNALRKAGREKAKEAGEAEAEASSDEGAETAGEGGGQADLPVKVPRDEEIAIPDHMPYTVVIVDELADLMQTAPADVESAIARITQMARAAGIHMIVATQTPRADVITGVIKANVPSRIAFQVASKLDSRVILDENGAERLLGQGDMLYLPPGTSRLVRSQGVLVTDEEIGRLVDFVGAVHEPAFDNDIHARLESDIPPEEEVSEEDEEIYRKCLEIIRQEKRASTSLLQRRLKLGYTRAARIVDILEQRGIIGPGEGAKPREILVDLDTLETQV